LWGSGGLKFYKHLLHFEYWWLSLDEKTNTNSYEETKKWNPFFNPGKYEDLQQRLKKEVEKNKLRLEDINGTSLQKNLNSKFVKTISQRIKNYQDINPYCATTKKAYDKRNHRVNGILCNQFTCARCRKKLKQKIFEKASENILKLDLSRHLVLTTEGDAYRDDHTVEQSYEDMSSSWYKLHRIINYHYGERKKIGNKIVFASPMEYICFPRAQKDGYCHYHILTNKYVPKKFLKEKSSKYGNMGYLKIKQNKDTIGYLSKDFFKDPEWYIPEGFRHYNCTKNVDLKIRVVDEDWRIDNVPFELKNTGVPIVDQIYKITSDAVCNIEMVNNQVKTKMSYPPPIEELVKGFYK